MASEIQQFLRDHGISEVEAIIPDMAGIARGKVMPAEKFAPECAAFPVTSKRMNTPPLRPLTTAPLGRPGSELNTARARRASLSR